MRLPGSVKLLASLLFIGVSTSSLRAHHIAQRYGPLAESAKSAITASDAPAKPPCYDFAQSNCSATKSDGSLDACGAAYTGPCNGSCDGACSQTSQYTWTRQAGTTTLDASLADSTSIDSSCGASRTLGGCTPVPNNATTAGSGCYCSGGKPSGTNCGKAQQMTDTLHRTCPADP